MKTMKTVKTARTEANGHARSAAGSPIHPVPSPSGNGVSARMDGHRDLRAGAGSAPAAHVELYTQAVALSRAAFADRHYATAYHALAAALHLAQDVGSAAWLGDVEALAADQLAELDSREPGHLLASRASEARGHANLWQSLGHQAHIRRTLLEHLHRIHLP